MLPLRKTFDLGLILQTRYMELGRKGVRIEGSWYKIDPDRLYIIYKIIDRRSKVFDNYFISIWKNGEWQERAVKLDEKVISAQIRKHKDQNTKQFIENKELQLANANRIAHELMSYQSNINKRDIRKVLDSIKKETELRTMMQKLKL